MELYAIDSIPNDLGIEETKLNTVSQIFDDFKSLPELVLNEEELKKYQITILNKLKNDINKTTRTQTDSNELEDMDIDELEVKLENFVGIDEFEIKSFKEQILSITIININSVIGESLQSIELFLKLVFKELSIPKFKWCTIEEEIDLRPIYVNFSKVSDLVKFVGYYEKLDEKFGTVVMDSNVENLYKDNNKDEINELNVNKELIDKLYDELHHHNHLSRTEGGKGEIDIYSDYKVDSKELVDVPKDLIDTVKNDIVEFRLRVLKLEKTKREKDAINDKRKSRFKLKKLYQDISKTKSADDDDEDDYEDKEEDFNGADGEGYDDEDDDLNDSDVEVASQNRLTELIENEYLAKLKIIKEQDANRAKLYKTYVTLQNYETNVKLKKDKFYKDFIMIESTDNKVDNNLDKFYLNHSNYLKFRDSAKLKEETKDNLDKDISKYINELIQEFIGVEEDESLNKFIIGLTDENYPTTKTKVIELLRETLDEDAEVFVNKLWDYINI